MSARKASGLRRLTRSALADALEQQTHATARAIVAPDPTNAERVALRRTGAGLGRNASVGELAAYAAGAGASGDVAREALEALGEELDVLAFAVSGGYADGATERLEAHVLRLGMRAAAAAELDRRMRAGKGGAP